MQYIQTLACQDRPNIIKEVCEFVAKFSGNILEMEQHVDQTEGLFFLRLVWETEKSLTPEGLTAEFAQHMPETLLANKFCPKQHKTRVAILVSKMDHCLFELLMRFHKGEWAIELPIVLSNHPDLEELCTKFNIPYKYLPINGNKPEQEQQILDILAELAIDTVILARYMQILTPNFIAHYPNAIINIHHSFLPAFIGAKPYHQAYQQGVKMVGATSHYVTDQLDKGPIICQDTTPVNHTHSVADFIHMGKDVEKQVLIKAVTAHFEHRIIVIDNKTIVFR